MAQGTHASANPVFAQKLVDCESFRVNLRQPFKHTSGFWAPVYVNCRMLSLSPDVRGEVLSDLMGLANPLRNKIIAGVQQGGVLWSLPIADRLNGIHIPISSAQEKNNFWVGHDSFAGRNAVLFEDVCNSGGSSLGALKCLEAAGITVSLCCSIFAYNRMRMHQKFSELGVPFKCIVELADFREPMARKGLSEEDWDKVLAWAANPQAWHDTWVAAHPGS